MKNQPSFFELYDELQMEAIEELIEDMKKQRRWRFMSELIQLKEEINSSKKAV